MTQPHPSRHGASLTLDTLMADLAHEAEGARREVRARARRLAPRPEPWRAPRVEAPRDGGENVNDVHEFTTAPPEPLDAAPPLPKCKVRSALWVLGVLVLAAEAVLIAHLWPAPAAAPPAAAPAAALQARVVHGPPTPLVRRGAAGEIASAAAVASAEGVAAAHAAEATLPDLAAARLVASASEAAAVDPPKGTRPLGTRPPLLRVDLDAFDTGKRRR